MKRSILVVDDDVINIKIAQSHLAQEYNIMSATSAQMLFKILEHKEPDLILLDISMPVMDGFEAIKVLKSNLKTAKIPVIFLTAKQSPDVETQALEAGAMDFIQKPFSPAVLKNRIANSLALVEHQKFLEEKVQTQEREILAHLSRINSMQQEVIISMANLIESRDGSTGTHVKRCGAYVELLATKLKQISKYSEIFTPEYTEALIKAAYLHDIGKVKIKDAVLQKPAKLTDEGYEHIKTHALEGGKIINEIFTHIVDSDYLKVLYDVATYHHEKYSGGGYPHNLKGDEMPLGARIMAVADVFDALISRRCYKDPMTFDKAFGIIEEGMGLHFDPDIAKIFLEEREAVIKIVEAQP